ncbi:MAG: MFS transporter [Thermomicrobiales bacterium]|nr:MFS transporter [Thermomicrobiales bacterium]
MTTSAPPPRFIILVLMAIISVIPLNMFVPSLPKIADDFDVEYAVVNFAIGGYAVVSALTQVIGGALSDRYGRRPVALASLGIFTLASIGCLLAPNVYLFLGFRMAQGTVAASQAVAMAAIRDTHEGPEMRSRIGSLSSAWAFGPMIGPTLGGVLASVFGWHSNFVLFTVLGAIAFTLVYTGFAETNRDRSSRLFDTANYATFIRSGMFWACSGLMAFSIGLLYVYLGSAPTVAKEFGSLTEIHVGIFLGLLPLGFMISSAITARISLRVPPHHLILFGRLLTVAGFSSGLLLYFGGASHPLSFFLPCMSIGLGNGFTLPSANAVVLTIAGKSAGTALGLAAAITIGGAALLSSISGFAMHGESVRLSSLWFMFGQAAIALTIAVGIYRTMRGRAST